MESPRTLEALTNDLVVEIFLRIGSPADLVRASAACVAFCRLIANPSFLRRYRSVHPPLLIGLLDPYGDIEPTETPHPSAALAGAVARAADLRFGEYFPSSKLSGYCVSDVRDGHVLLTITPYLEDDEDEKLVPDLAVCDPLARVCLRLPPIPDDLLASVQVQQQDLVHYSCDTFLVPSGDEEDATSFRVIVMMRSTQMLVAFIFSSTTGDWSAGSPFSLGSLRIPYDNIPSYAYGCFYWKVESENRLLKLNMSSMEFSVVDLPPGPDRSFVIMVEAGESRLGMFSLINHGTTLCYSIRQIGSEKSNQLEMDSVIPLPEGYIYFRIHGSYEGHILIFGYAFSEDACFALEIKTMKIERVCRKWRGFCPYFVFLPSMSQRRI